MRLKYLLFGLLLTLHNISAAKPCTVVAEVHVATNSYDITVIRDMRHHDLASLKNAVCADDIVIIPETCNQPITLHYYSENLDRQTLIAGQEYEIQALENPCGKWCKLTRKTKRLYLHLTRKQVNPPKRIVATERGDNEDFPISTLITNPTQALSLFADNGAASFFWKGGKAPYNLTIKNKQGQVVEKITKLHAKHAAFTLPNTQANQTYQIILEDRQKKRLETNVILRLPPFPLNPEENQLLRLTKLLLDPQHNWRLEVWRQLQALPDSHKVAKFKAHLIVNDF